MKGNQHEEVRSLLDGQIKAAAGAVVGAKDQHHILVADGAAQGFLIPHQRHGVNGLQTLHQTFRVILTLIQSHKANHALQDAGAEGIGVTLPALCQHGQGFFVKVCAVGFVFLESRADADDLPRGTVAVQTELQTGAFGGFHECERFRVFAHQSGAQLCASGQRRGNARLPGKQHGFFFLCQSLVHFADNRKILPAVHRPTGHDGMLTVKDEVVTVPVADLGRVGDQFGELRRHLFDIGDALHEKIKKAEGTMREQLIAQHKQLTKQLFRTPAKACTDKRLKYVRYADDFLIAVNGTREECEAIKAKLTDFVRDTLKMELSQEKTLITHSNTPARFLGFDVRVRRDASVKRSGKRKMRTMNNKVELNIPLKDKVETYLLSHSIAKRDGKRLIPIHRPILLNRTDLEIVMIYNAELRGLCNYYAIASNFNKLVYFGYLMEYSCLKTLANKHRSRISKVRYEYRDGTGAWGVPYETKKGKRRMMFAKYSDCKGKDLTEKVPDLAYRYSHNTTSFEERLKAKVCEVCGCTDSDSYEIHHVNKVKNLKGKADWEKVMLAKRRKTIVVCHKCHMRIHHGTKTE